MKLSIDEPHLRVHEPVPAYPAVASGCRHLQHGVGTHVCLPRRKLCLGHLTGVGRKQSDEDLEFNSVIVRELLRLNARQNRLRSARGIAGHHQGHADELGNFVLLLRARLPSEDHKYLEPDPLFHLRHIFRLRQHGLNFRFGFGSCSSDTARCGNYCDGHCPSFS